MWFHHWAGEMAQKQRTHSVPDPHPAVHDCNSRCKGSSASGLWGCQHLYPYLHTDICKNCKIKCLGKRIWHHPEKTTSVIHNELSGEITLLNNFIKCPAILGFHRMNNLVEIKNDQGGVALDHMNGVHCVHFEGLHVSTLEIPEVLCPKHVIV